MTAALESPNADAAVRGLLSQYLAEKFRHAGFVHEAAIFAGVFQSLKQDIARVLGRADIIRSFAIPLELYLFAHEAGHMLMEDDVGFTSTFKLHIVQIVEVFVKAKRSKSVDPTDPALKWWPEGEVLKIRRHIQAEWLELLQSSNALQEELVADDIARVVCFSDITASKDPLKTATTILVIHLNLCVLELLDSWVRTYPTPRTEEGSAASELLLRTEYAVGDLSFHVTRMSDVAEGDVLSALRHVSFVHKELYNRIMINFIAPMLVALQSGKGGGDVNWSLNGVEQESRELRLLDTLLLD